MLKLKYIVFTLFLSIVLTSCHKDPADETYNDVIPNITTKVYQEIKSTIVGSIYDENNNPVENATVATYSTVTKTNKHGVFVMKNINTDQQGTYIKAIKEGYILGSDFVYPLPGKISYSYIKMMKLDSNKRFESKNGGTISADNGGKIIFPADAINTASGDTYTGNVTVTAKYLHPNDKELNNVMAGGLIADAENGNTVVLGTLGMMAVELRSPNGQKLNLKIGSQATIEFPVVTSYKPSTINLWYFDEDKGRWKEEGTATLDGDKYVAKVSHFSFWNCDAPFPLIEICGKVVYRDGTPVKNTSIVVQADGLNAAYGMTNDEGKFCGKMPKGKKLIIKVHNFNCIQQLGNVEVGPFENNTQLNDIVIDKVPTYKIFGKLHCNNDVIKDGIIVTKVKEFRLVNLLGEDGKFSIDMTPYTCGESLNVSIFGFDNSSTKTSETITLTSPPTDEVNLNVCASACDYTAILKFDCNNRIDTEIKGGSGNFSYNWEDNSKNSFIITQPDSLGSKIYCVTITDIVDNCIKTFCKSVGQIRAGVEGGCDNLSAYHFGGVEPITYLWSNGSKEREINNLAEGTYCLTVTDFNGCTSTVCEVIIGNSIILDPKPSGCNNAMVSFNSSPFNFGYFYQPGTNINGSISFPISINIFNAGFNFVLDISNLNCNKSQNIKLPQLINGLTTSVINTTCGTCNDGKINVTVNNSATCFDCKIGQTKIYRVNNLDVELSNENNAGQLPKGEYYVVVTDANTNCFIAFNKVKIQ